MMIQKMDCAWLQNNYLEDDDGYMQDIVIVGPKYHFDENNNIVHEKPIDESYTYSRDIKQYEYDE